MTQEELQAHIADAYGVKPDYPWESDLEYAVFRHSKNKKWFALIMRIDRSRLDPNTHGAVDIVNVKIEPASLGSLLASDGVYRAYHMNKTNWVSIALDGSAQDDLVKLLVDVSFGLTKKK